MQKHVTVEIRVCSIYFSPCSSTGMANCPQFLTNFRQGGSCACGGAGIRERGKGTGVVKVETVSLKNASDSLND